MNSIILFCFIQDEKSEKVFKVTIDKRKYIIDFQEAIKKKLDVSNNVKAKDLTYFVEKTKIELKIHELFVEKKICQKELEKFSIIYSRKTCQCHSRRTLYIESRN
ncbi:hypothetical protein C2G38_2209234 [Gigaspora rosea]|uniref:Crinkler effector protein N-terminal domain-containing protein n=1 Tax=Gigaspora rosea TaxID=44941 RepID=A0A397UGN4_9GLOM|nr:hypothetical protein C2G38_2209234 [Gigaspora rosea]